MRYRVPVIINLTPEQLQAIYSGGYLESSFLKDFNLRGGTHWNFPRHKINIVVFSTKDEVGVTQVYYHIEKTCSLVLLGKSVNHISECRFFKKWYYRE